MKQPFIIAAALVAAASIGIASAGELRSGVIIRQPWKTLNSSVKPDEGLTRLKKLYRTVFLGHTTQRGLTIRIGTPLRNEAGLVAYARAANTPGSLYYRHWLTPAQIGDAFGTPKATYTAMANYFTSQGLKVGTWPMRNTLAITGPTASMERALGTTFGHYKVLVGAGRRFRAVDVTAPETAPTITAMMPGIELVHLMKLNLLATQYVTTAPPEPISGGVADNFVNGLTPQQIANAFNYQGAYDAGYTGAGVTVGVIGTGPITLNDVPNFKKIFNVQGSSTLTEVPATINGDTTPPPATGPCSGGPTAIVTGGSSTAPTAGCNPEDLEAQLDTEQTTTLARDASVRFYLAYNSEGCAVISNPLGAGCVGPNEAEQGLAIPEDEIDTAIADNASDILSLSYGGCETLEGIPEVGDLTPNPGGDATGHAADEFSMTAAEGIATFVSTGDSGSAACEGGLAPVTSINYPADDPNVVAVGGTNTPVGPNGRLTGPITGWGDTTESGGASSAGVSTLFLTPPYQTSNATAGGTPLLTACTMRCIPDVDLDGDPYTGVPLIYDTGVTGGAMNEPIGGTSVAAPQMAAMWALVLSACKVTPSCGGGYGSNVSDPVSGYTPPAATAYRLGNPDYYWYKLAAASQATTYHDVFYDIVYGNDGEPVAALGEVGSVLGGGVSEYAAGIVPGTVYAGPGLDEDSGLGAPNARELIRYIVGV